MLISDWSSDVCSSDLAPAAAARPALALLLLLSLAGCLAGPEDRQPVLDVPAAWKEAGTGGTEWPESGWWRAFGSPELDALVTLAERDRKSTRLNSSH